MSDERGTMRGAVAARLESGAFDGELARAASHVWARVAAGSVARPLRWKAGARVITVGGATLGGSGKTALALACALACAELLRDAGIVALVGHAYRASPGRARLVRPDDDVRVVGDEALMCARELARRGARAFVFVGRDRQEALDLALAHADVAIVDGVAQSSPARAALALLAVDADEPWGRGSCPPRGDLRAPTRALLDACDRVVTISAPTRFARFEGDADGASFSRFDPRPVDAARATSSGPTLEGRRLAWEELRGLRVALWTSLARPARLLATLSAVGVTPALHFGLGDHAHPSPRDLDAAASRARFARVDLWLASPKCGTHLAKPIGGVPVAVLDYALNLPKSLASALQDAVQGSAARGAPHLDPKGRSPYSEGFESL